MTKGECKRKNVNESETASHNDFFSNCVYLFYAIKKGFLGVFVGRADDSKACLMLYAPWGSTWAGDGAEKACTLPGAIPPR